MRTIYEQFAHGSYVDYELIVQWPVTPIRPDITMRVKLHSDSSYPFQSTAKVELWLPDVGWKELHSPNPLTMTAVWSTASPHNRDKHAVELSLHNAADRMIAVACQIIGLTAKA